MTDSNALLIATRQIEFARAYTRRLLSDLSDDDWFAQPAGFPNHVAWQVGHLAVAEYGLCLFRIRGRGPDDTRLMPSTFRKTFSRGTIPRTQRDANPEPAEIRKVFDAVHEEAMRLLAQVGAGSLSKPVEMPYSVEPTQLGGLFFCSAHEMLHAGQIGAIRRLLGKEPLSAAEN